jgi:hypothetical protein
VVDVSTGARRTWTGDAMLSDLNWAPDDRTLLMHAQGCCGDYQPGVSRLDTRASGRSFAQGPDTPGTGDDQGCGISVTASSDAEVYAAQECFEAQEVRVVVLDPVTGRIVRRVATIQGTDRVVSMAITADGKHVVVSAPAEGAGNYRIDDRKVSQLPTQLAVIAW